MSGLSAQRMFVACGEPSRSLDDFISFWAWLYPDRTEPTYTDNIGQCKTFEQVLQLFKWKFRRFAEYRSDRLQADYENLMCRWDGTTSAADFLAGPFQTQGPIWRLFWLHCCCPERFPIFDQHVHRAMVYIRDEDADRLKIQLDVTAAYKIYLDEYLPFHSHFHDIKQRGPFDREINRALFTFGWTISQKRWTVEPWSGT